jgi:hypothetical protein
MRFIDIRRIGLLFVFYLRGIRAGGTGGNYRAKLRILLDFCI